MSPMKIQHLAIKKIITGLAGIIFTLTISSSVFSQGVGIDITTPNTKLDINGDIALRIGSYTAGGTNNNIAIGTSSFVRLSGPTGAYSISGVSGGVNGKIVILYNSTSYDLFINHESGSSVAANRIWCSDNASKTIKSKGCASLIYSSTDNRWILFSNTL